ncbi:SNF1-related protein kinase regulatory subunit beta-2-like [Impatiens glandulifera]|uniref:SNF1-related protein kinase regulatory subunit beta-2-like n=1 Tax=Impatiens glandulifera TaxID=253017 RepID=UPI001FB18EF6|nr:SNF1-related protein kinase regulatory subunit beta-2-like [Impatiens glandulifera]
MGNVTGRIEEAESSETSKLEEEEEYMMEEYSAPAPAPPSLFHDSSILQSPEPHSPRAYYSPYLQLPCNEEDMVAEKGIPTMIIWNYDGANHVAVEGSWDNWTRREWLVRSDKDFALLKVLPSGVYHYRFLVDGYWRCSPDVPREFDDMGNIYNVLDLQDHVTTDIWNNISSLGLDTPSSSPDSSYNNAAFTLEDSNEKLPELPPLLLQQSPLKNDSESLKKPLPAILNHLHVQKMPTGQSVLALSTTQRFHSKFVTLVLYKPSKKVKK